MATLKIVLHSMWAFVWYVLRSLAYSCWSGGILFLGTVLIVAFAAWLAGVSSPREPAITAGIVIGGLWGIGEFVWRLWRFFDTFHDLWVKAKVQKVLEDDV